jgi:hypothetical protein
MLPVLLVAEFGQVKGTPGNGFVGITVASMVSNGLRCRPGFTKLA